MNLKTLIKSNKAIAKMIGDSMEIPWMPNGVETIDLAEAVKKTDIYNSPNYLKFHCSYAWLMSVVERIERLGGIMTIKGNTVEMQYKFGGVGAYYSFEKKMDAIWHACVDYANWYNAANEL